MAYIAALRQAKFYPPWQAAAAADCALWLLHTSRKPFFTVPENRTHLYIVGFNIDELEN